MKTVQYKILGFLFFLLLVVLGVVAGILIRNALQQQKMSSAGYEIAQPELAPPQSRPFVEAPVQN